MALYPMCVDFIFPFMNFPKLFLMSKTMSILFFWQLIPKCCFTGQLADSKYVYMSILNAVKYRENLKSNLNTNQLPCKYSLIGLSPFFIKTGELLYPLMYATVPAPVGPSFPKAEPSMNSKTSWSVLWLKNYLCSTPVLL